TAVRLLIHWSCAPAAAPSAASPASTAWKSSAGTPLSTSNMPEAAAEQVVPLRTGIDLCFDTFGARDDPAVLLVMGLGGPLSWWDPGLCSRLADRGFCVIRFDSRDVGHSTICPGQGPTAPGLVRAFLRGQRAHPPYTLHDLSEDCVALLDHLGITEVHLVGISM